MSAIGCFVSGDSLLRVRQCVAPCHVIACFVACFVACSEPAESGQASDRRWTQGRLTEDARPSDARRWASP